MDSNSTRHVIASGSYEIFIVAIVTILILANSSSLTTNIFSAVSQSGFSKGPVNNSSYITVDNNSNPDETVSDEDSTQENATTMSSKTNFPVYHFISKIGFPGTEKGQILEPTDLSIDTSHHIIYVADKNNNRIQKFDTNGKYIASWGSVGSNSGQFKQPADLAIDFSDNIIFVADIGNNRVQKFNTNGMFLGMWGSLGRNFGQFDHTGDIALDTKGKLVYVTDIGNHRIQKFDYDGKFISSWGTFGTGKTQFNRPAGVGYDSSGFVFVVDTMNNRIQKFDKEGNFLGMWGKVGKEKGQFDNPVSLTIDPISNYLYISDSGNKRIEIFNNNGKYIGEIGSSAASDGEFKRPVGVSFGDDGLIYVVDKDRGDIQVLGVSSEPTSTKLIKKTTLTTIKNEDQEQSSANNSETNKKSTLYIKFSDVFSYYGKTTVTIKNLETHKTLGKHTFDFAELHDKQKDKCCNSQMSFNNIGKKGDRLEVDAIDPNPDGGSVSDAGSLTLDPSLHLYHIKLGLDEFGCSNCD